MKWVSAAYASDSFEHAIALAGADIKRKLGRSKADLGFLFVSSAFRQEVIDLWATVRKELPIKFVLGCTAGGVIGGESEFEEKPAVSITAAVLPKVKISAFDLQQDKLPSSDGSPRPWRDLVGESADKKPQFLLLSDPFSIDSDALVEGLDYAFPDSIKLGGLASGTVEPNQNLLINNEKLLHSGAIGVALTGELHVEPVVAQGCRPIGRPIAITDCKENILISLENKPPLKHLSEIYPTLNKRDQGLISHSLFVGIQMNSLTSEPKQGDFLIRNIIGLDQEKGIMAIGSMLRKGQNVQFHLRDANTSHDDLKLMLMKLDKSSLKVVPDNGESSSGVLLFSCLGRGHRLYGKKDHDLNLVKSIVGNVPVGGFFCNGEIGPVRGKTYLHGYTSSIGIISPPTPKEN